MAKQCWSQTVLESGSWGHSVLQTPALVYLILLKHAQIVCIIEKNSPIEKKEIMSKIMGKGTISNFG